MNTAVRSRRRRGASTAALVALLFGALSTAVSAAPPSEVPGNNGTVKIHEGAGEPAPEVRNEPHVCTFHLHFFFADAADSGTWEIQEWSPGDKGAVVLSGTYLTDADGEDRDPEASAYSLPDGHYKLFWDGDLDTKKHDKHKVFWVDCPAPTPVVTATPTPTPVVTSTSTPTPVVTPTPTPEGEVLPTATPVGEVLPTANPVVTPTPITPTPTPVGGVLGATGTPTPTGPGGDVGAATGLPGTTLPPTDAIGHSSGSTGSGLAMVLILLAAMFASLSLALVLPLRRTDRS